MNANFYCFLFQLINQLALGGRLICPVSVAGYPKYQQLLQVDKTLDGKIETKKLLDVSYVLLTDAKTQLHNR